MAYQTIPPSGAGDLTSVASADGSITVTGGSGPDVDLAVARSLATGLPGPWITETIGSAVQDHDLAGATVNGDLDGGYEMWVYLINVAGTSVLTLQPNAAATSKAGLVLYFQTVSPAGGARTDFNVGYAGATGDATAMQAHIYLTAKTGKSRFFLSDAMNAGSVSGTAIHELNKVIWTDTSTNITSLRFHSNIASGIGVGTIFKWRKLYAGL